MRITPHPAPGSRPHSHAGARPGIPATSGKETAVAGHGELAFVSPGPPAGAGRGHRGAAACADPGDDAAGPALLPGWPVAGVPGPQRQPVGSGVHGVAGVRRCQRGGRARPGPPTTAACCMPRGMASGCCPAFPGGRPGSPRRCSPLATGRPATGRSTGSASSRGGRARSPEVRDETARTAGAEHDQPVLHGIRPLAVSLRPVYAPAPRDHRQHGRQSPGAATSCGSPPEGLRTREPGSSFPPHLPRRRRIPGERSPRLGSAQPIACDATRGSDLDTAAGSGTLDRPGRRHRTQHPAACRVSLTDQRRTET